MARRTHSLMSETRHLPTSQGFQHGRRHLPPGCAGIANRATDGNGRIRAGTAMEDREKRETHRDIRLNGEIFARDFRCSIGAAVSRIIAVFIRFFIRPNEIPDRKIFATRDPCHDRVQLK